MQSAGRGAGLTATPGLLRWMLTIAVSVCFVVTYNLVGEHAPPTDWWGMLSVLLLFVGLGMPASLGLRLHELPLRRRFWPVVGFSAICATASTATLYRHYLATLHLAEAVGPVAADLPLRAAFFTTFVIGATSAARWLHCRRANRVGR